MCAVGAAFFKTRTDGRLACRAGKSGCVAKYGPACGDQVKGIVLRHLHDAIQTDTDVSAREGLDRCTPIRKTAFGQPLVELRGGPGGWHLGGLVDKI